MITRLIIENFLPFRDRVELNLADRGVVLVRGDVRVSAATDSNGAGKTSVPGAICWALFGEDLRGRKADAVANRFTDATCRVHLEMVDALGAWWVRRTRRPASLTTGGIPGVLENEDMRVLQQKVEQRLGFGLRTFKNAVVFGQGAFERFSLADQAEQMRMFDEIQGLDLKPALKRATAWRADLSEKLRALEADVASRGEEIDGLVESLRVQQAAREGYEGIIRDQVAALERDIAAAAERRLVAARELEAIKTLRAALPPLHAALARERALAEHADALFRRSRELDLAFQRATDKREDLERRLAELMDSGACPTCRRPVQKQRDAIKRLFAPKLKKLGDAADAAYAAFKPAADAYNVKKAEHLAQAQLVLKVVPDEHRGNVQRYVASIEAAIAREAQQDALWKRADKEMADLKARVDSARSAPWSGADDLRKTERALADARATLVRLTLRADKLADALKMADYCVEAFGDRGIRSVLADGLADYINDRIAAHLEVLACGEATNRMSTQKDLKGGGTRERISFTPSWSWGGEGADSGSGGQDQRMNLAVFAAAQDLSESRSARPFPIKVFDEPFDSLDARGMELAAQWIRQQAREHGTVLLITHSKEMEALVDADVTWTVVLDDAGARVVES